MERASRTKGSRRGAWLLLAAALPLLGCGAVVQGGRLSHRPHAEVDLFMTTGNSPRPYRTLGFIQVTGEGRTYGGVADVGDAGLDGVIRGALAHEARKMGGDGVIHIEFLDENPQTDYERYQQAAETISNLAEGKGGVSEKQRTVVVTGEVIQFIQ